MPNDHQREPWFTTRSDKEKSDRFWSAFIVNSESRQEKAAAKADAREGSAGWFWLAIASLILFVVSALLRPLVVGGWGEVGPWIIRCLDT